MANDSYRAFFEKLSSLNTSFMLFMIVYSPPAFINFFIFRDAYSSLTDKATCII